MEESKRKSIIIDELEIENKILKENLKKKEDIMKNIIETKENNIKELKQSYIEEKNIREGLVLDLERIYNSRSYKLTQKIKKILRR